ncbi:pksN [Symbiodinium natans]|uniref:PksN protein n=1 Tax=Symbiodinium natans TaxID=878477 RepID=A0A812V5P5_9DINO|nr:pksN [Symbiodinium natans]
MRQTTRAERGLPPREHPRSHYRADGRRRRTATELRQRGWQSWEGHNEWRHGATESTGWWHGWNSWTESTEWHSEEAESQGDGQPGTVSDGPSSSSAQAVKIKAQDQGEPHMEEADVPAPAINPVVDGTTPDMMNEVRTPTADPVASETTTDEEELIPAKEHAAVQHAAVQCGPVTCDQATQTSDNERPGKAAPGNYTPQGLPLQSVAMKADEHPIEETSGEVCGARRGGDARGAVRRAQTIGPERVPPHQGLNAAARLHLGKAKQLLGELLPSNPGASLTAFQMQGHYKFRHDLYHKAQQGEAYDIRGQHIDSPLLTDNVGRWIWSLVGALLTHDKLGQVQSWQTGGDLVESWMHSLWTTQGQAELDILAGVSRLASHLHDGLQNLPRALYLQLQWKTHWPEFFQALMPYLYRPDCIDGPLEASRLCNAMESMPAVQYMSRVPALHGLCDTWITHPTCPLQDTCIPTVRSCTQVKAASELHPICADTAWTSSDSQAGAGSRGSRSAGTTQRDAPAQRVPAEGTREHDTPEGWPWTLLDANSVSAPTPSAQRAQPASSSSTAVTEPQDHEQDHDKGSAQDRSRTPARRSARDPTITSRTDATPDCPTRRDDINGVLTEILREPGHRYGVQVRQDGFASAIELACSPLLQAHGISLGDIRWIVDVRDRQRYQWCDIQGSSHIRLIMSRDLPTDMGGTPHFSSPTAPTGSAEKVIDSFVAGENQGAGLGVGQPRNNTRSQNSSDQQIRYAAQKRQLSYMHGPAGEPDLPTPQWKTISGRLNLGDLRWEDGGGRAFMPDTKTYAYLFLVVPQPIHRHRLPRGAAELLEWSETEDETVGPPASKRQRTEKTASGDGQQQIDGPTKEPRTPQQWVLRAADTSQIIDLDDYKEPKKASESPAAPALTSNQMCKAFLHDLRALRPADQRRRAHKLLQHWEAMEERLGND